ncbi:RrF2 family transcriptional regulator [Actibacterium pelagium]|uniref:Rrf2 family transcriptional regulator n=1 Tax=Actibacterium pelagium TaxID=2029103 RepID=A0A917AP47_9RHOB|nr:Rrf2 family transcriptional regulator [Actibacterium pelagium]GGE61040.1 Rrf2 family transcriptional regulator [Actibacterium pelagium]
MRITMRTNIAMRALMFCAVNQGRIVRKSEIAEACNTSENHLAQVINQLSRLGFLDTLRGRGGGIKLNREPKDISVGNVFRSLEGTLPLAECFTGGENTCPIKNACRLKGTLSRAQEAFYAELDKVNLRDLTQDNDQLCGILMAEA